MVWDLVKIVRPHALVAFLASWISLFLVGIWLNEGAGRIRTLPAAAVFTFSCAAFAVFALVAARPGALQRSILRADANLTHARPVLHWFGLICALLAVGGAMMGFSTLRGHT